jgi:Cu+-exporting ATPase
MTAAHLHSEPILLFEKDPVCGMDLNPSDSESFTFNEKIYHFCSEHCQNKFKANPKNII